MKKILWVILFMLFLFGCDALTGNDDNTVEPQVSASEILSHLPKDYIVKFRVTTTMRINGVIETTIAYSTYLITNDGFAMAVGIDDYSTDYMMVCYCSGSSCDLYVKTFMLGDNFTLIPKWQFAEKISFINSHNAYYPENNLFYEYLFYGTLIDDKEHEHHDITYKDMNMSIYTFNLTENDIEMDCEFYIEKATNIAWKATIEMSIGSELQTIIFEIDSITEGATLPVIS